MISPLSLFRLALLAVPLTLLGACSNVPLRAPVIERAAPQVDATPRVAASAVVAVPEASHEPAPTGTYTVKKGDTLIRIALDHGQNYRDLVSWNNLVNPNDIKVDQVLRVAPPETAGTPGALATAAITPPIAEPRLAPAKKITAPRGDKRPYSEATLADMQKSDGSVAKVDAKPSIDKTPEVPPVVLAPAASAPSAPLADDDKLSWTWPAEGKLVTTFDDSKGKGIDIGGKVGQPVLAAGAGKIMYAGSGIRGYGNLVIVKHSNTVNSVYAHNRSILVKEGNSVAKGQLIAEMGDTDAETVKLHFEIRLQGKPVDPFKFLPNR